MPRKKKSPTLTPKAKRLADELRREEARKAKAALNAEQAALLAELKREERRMLRESLEGGVLDELNGRVLDLEDDVEELKLKATVPDAPAPVAPVANPDVVTGLVLEVKSLRRDLDQRSDDPPPESPELKSAIERMRAEIEDMSARLGKWEELRKRIKKVEDDLKEAKRKSSTMSVGGFAASIPASATGGGVQGQQSSTDGNLAVFDGTDGQKIKDGGPIPTVSVGTVSALNPNQTPTVGSTAGAGNQTTLNFGLPAAAEISVGNTVTVNPTFPAAVSARTDAAGNTILDFEIPRGSTGAAGTGEIYYLSATADDDAPLYKSLQGLTDENESSVSLPGQGVKFVTPRNSPGVSLIKPGTWRLKLWVGIEWLTQNTSWVEVSVWKKEYEGEYTETELFTAQSDTIDPEDLTGLVEIVFEQNAPIVLNPAESLGITLTAFTGSNPATLYLGGLERPSHIATPIEAKIAATDVSFLPDDFSIWSTNPEKVSQALNELAAKPTATPAANGIPRAGGTGEIARGWYGNLATGEGSFAYGASHDASGDYIGCFGGGNSVTADYAFAAGTGISATAKGAFGSGVGADAKIHGLRAHSSGLQAQGAISQAIEGTLTGTSEPGTEEIELFLDGISERFVIGNNRILNLLVFVTGCTIGGTSWVRNCRQIAVRRDTANGLQFVGEQFIIGANYQSDRVTLGLDQFNNALTITVSGFTGDVTCWSALIYGSELGVYESYFWAP